MSEKNFSSAFEVQTKYNFYLVALVFTTLAAAINTASFSSSKVSTASELLAWCLLLMSGLCGLKRLEMLPSIYNLNDLSGKDEAAEKYRNEAIEKKQKIAYRYYVVHKLLFVAGLCSLVLSRGYSPLVCLFH
jgi:hypothetical protein